MPIVENSNKASQAGGDWDALDALKYQNEREAIAALLADPPLSPSERSSVEHTAIALVTATRENARRAVGAGGGSSALILHLREPEHRPW